MADTALNEEEIKEYFDSPEELEQKVKKLAMFIRHSKHFVCYTGAGISTSAGINDFRGPSGVWTAKAKGLVPVASKQNPEPTITHMSLVQLMRNGYLKFLVSQNCDGLHLKSGIPVDKIAELHGNSMVEACAKCGKVYYKGKRVQHSRNKTRLTGNMCNSECGGSLRCTTVAFSQSMPDVCFDIAEKQSKMSDLSLCMGTSMRVTPACELPTMGLKRRGKMVIVNLQNTPYDHQCALRIFAKCDDVMKMLMSELDLQVPEWQDLNLVEDQEWMTQFDKYWPFRTAGSTDWFDGNIF